MSHPALSIVVPALNEALALPTTLQALAVLDAATPREVIVVDGGSSDATCDLAAQSGASVLRSATGRAPQMNAGAAHARGEWLVFLHADTCLSEGALAAICALPPSAQWGAFRQRFTGDDWRLRMISAAHNWRARVTGIHYGDQTLFVRRALFAQVGGYANDLIEDVLLSETLRTHAPSTLLPQISLTSSRKFEQLGVWRALGYVLRIVWARSQRCAPPVPQFFAPFR